MKPWKHLVVEAGTSEDKLRKAERAFVSSGSSQDRDRYVRLLKRAGELDKAEFLESMGVLQDLVKDVRWNKPDKDQLERLAKHYSLDEIKQMAGSNTPNRINVLAITDAVYHRHLTMADGSPRRYRVNGKLKTWKTRPEDFRLPVMYGGFNRNSDSVHLSPLNANQFMIDTDGP